MSIGLDDPATLLLVVVAVVVVAGAAATSLLLALRRLPPRLRESADEEYGTRWEVAAPTQDVAAAQERRAQKVRGVLEMAQRHLGIYRDLGPSLESGDQARLASVLERLQRDEELSQDVSYLTVGDPDFAQAALGYVAADQACAQAVTELATTGRSAEVPRRLGELLPSVEHAAARLRAAADAYVQGGSAGPS